MVDDSTEYAETVKSSWYSTWHSTRVSASIVPLRHLSISRLISGCLVVMEKTLIKAVRPCIAVLEMTL
jgi:hypothetical protein